MTSNTLVINPFTLSSSEADQAALQNYSQYDTLWDAGNTLQRRKELYEKMPNIETLRITVDGFLNQSYYLRPLIKQIHLDFNLTFAEERGFHRLEFLYPEAFIHWFQAIQNHVVKQPESQLEELHIRFNRKVRLHLCIENYFTVDYDDYGPIYEDETWFEDTSEHNPSDYFSLLRKESHKDLHTIGSALLKLLSLRSWKAITVPSSFPFAQIIVEKYPNTKLIDEVTKEGVKERVISSLKEFHKERRKELRAMKLGREN